MIVSVVGFAAILMPVPATNVNVSSTPSAIAVFAPTVILANELEEPPPLAVTGDQ